MSGATSVFGAPTIPVFGARRVTFGDDSEVKHEELIVDDQPKRRGRPPKSPLAVVTLPKLGRPPKAKSQYSDVLADLREKRDQIDVAIKAIEALA